MWGYIRSRREQFLNPKYDAVVDDNVRGKERLIFPRTDEIRWWSEVFGRTEEEMNPKVRPLHQGNGVVALDLGLSSSLSSSSQGTRTPVLTGVETATQSIGPAAGPPYLSHAAPR